MAALSAVRNRKSQKLRDGFEDFLARCVERSEGRSEVQLDFVLEMLESMDIKIEEKEQRKLRNLANKNRKISRLSILRLTFNLYCLVTGMTLLTLPRAARQSRAWWRRR